VRTAENENVAIVGEAKAAQRHHSFESITVAVGRKIATWTWRAAPSGGTQ
jgi:hypothetical protein